MTASRFTTSALFRGTTRPAPAAAARPFRPLVLRAGEEPPAAPPSLLFDEAELARACAASAVSAACLAREEALAERGAVLLGRLAAVLEEDGERRRREEPARRACLVELVLAALSRLMDAQSAEQRVAPLARLVAEAAAMAEGQKLRVEVAPCDLAPLEAFLARPGLQPLPAGIELVASPQRAPGALDVTWPEGWLERDPALFLEQLGELLREAAAAPSLPSPEQDP